MASTGTAFFPGSASFPNTTQYPGQGNYPIVGCRFSFDDFSSSTPSWTDVARSKIRKFSVARGRNSELDTFDAGSASVTIDNRDRSYDPTVIATVRPMNRVWLYAEHAGSVYNLFRGYVESWDQEWPAGFDAVVVASAVDEFKVLNLQTLALTGTLTGTVAPDVRVGDALDSAHSMAPRSFVRDAAAATIQAESLTGQSVLDPIQNAVKSSAVDSNSTDAVFFASSSGVLTYLGTTHRASSPYNTVQATFGDAGGSELPYIEVTVDFSDSFLTNQWVLTTNGGATQTANDATSIATYGTRTRTISDLILTSDTDVLNYALARVAKYKDPMERVMRLTLDTLDADVAAATLARDLMDKITIKRTPPGGGARISQDLYVQRLEIGGANDGRPLSIQMGVSPL